MKASDPVRNWSRRPTGRELISRELSTSILQQEENPRFSDMTMNSQGFME